MTKHPSTMQVTAWVLGAIALIGMAFAALQDHRVAFNFIAVFALILVMVRLDAGEHYTPPLWLRLSLAVLYVSGFGLLAAGEFHAVSGGLVQFGRWLFIAALVAFLVVRVTGRYRQPSHEI